MHPIQELGQNVRQRRTDMALTQTALAQLSGLSRATINQIENGSIRDLSLSRTARLLDAVGLNVQLSPARQRHLHGNENLPHRSALELAAQSASVSYRTVLPASELGEVLSSGDIDPDFLPHVFTLLEEAPVSLLARVVEELHSQQGLAHAAVWQTMRRLARQLKSTRPIWQ
jgi:transcriptional regulator with XRE-family HTH domain